MVMDKGQNLGTEERWKLTFPRSGSRGLRKVKGLA